MLHRTHASGGFLAFLLLLGCGSGSGSSNDVGPEDSQSDQVSDHRTGDAREDGLGQDSAIPDLTADRRDLPDPDSNTEEVIDMLPDQADLDLAPDTAQDVEQEVTDVGPDIVTPTQYQAVPGERCTPANRVGEVVVTAYDYSPSLETYANISDRTNLWAPDVSLTSETCVFYKEKPAAFCDTCLNGTLCAPDGTCQEVAVPASDVVIKLSAGEETQTIEPQGGGTWGTVSLAGRSFSVQVQWSGWTVTLEETTVPDALANLTGTLAGGYDQPTALDLTWTPPASGGLLFTHIPINHHASGPTYTECAAEASTGSLHVDGAMLKPLAVITGLEFQGVQHVRFAAAQLPVGCLEFRFESQQYVNLEYN